MPKTHLLIWRIALALSLGRVRAKSLNKIVVSVGFCARKLTQGRLEIDPFSVGLGGKITTLPRLPLFFL